MKKNLLYLSAIGCCVIMFIVWHTMGGNDSVQVVNNIAEDKPYSETRQTPGMERRAEPTEEPAVTETPVVTKKTNINFATEEELALVPGINKSVARSIVIYREEHGYFEDVDELINVFGIGEKTLNNIRDLLSVF